MAKQLELVTGLVERINDKGTGIKVGGEWCNASQYVTPPVEMPKPGQRVNLQVERTDRGIWIQSIEVLDGGQVHQLPQPQRRGGGSGRSPAELRDIRWEHIANLKNANIFGVKDAPNGFVDWALKHGAQSAEVKPK